MQSEARGEFIRNLRLAQAVDDVGLQVERRERASRLTQVGLEFPADITYDVAQYQL